MRTLVLASLLVVLLWASSASAQCSLGQNRLSNGCFDDGENFWTRYPCDGGASTGGGCSWEIGDFCVPGEPPCDGLDCCVPPQAKAQYCDVGGGANNVGWYQIVDVCESRDVHLDACWCGDVSDQWGWAEIGMFNLSEAASSACEDIEAVIDDGPVSRICYKKDAWDMNGGASPWDCELASASPYNDGNPTGDLHSDGSGVVVFLKVGGVTTGGSWWTAFDCVTLTPEPATALLLGLPLLLVRRRRR